MKAVRIHEFGEPSVLKYEDAPKPAPHQGEVLVRVHAAGVNPIDWKVRAGYLRTYIPHSLPLIPGWDVSGVVEQVGDHVTDLALGDEVYGQLDVTRDGAYAEYVVSATDKLGKKPRSLDHVAAAAIPVAAMAAWSALARADVKAGQTVLIHAAAGGVGSYAVQFAKARSLKVIATGSASNVDFLKQLGADQVVDYNNQRFEDVGKKVDLVVDSIGGDTQARSWQVIRPGGALASLVGDQWAGEPRDDVNKFAVFGAMAAGDLGKITRLIDEGAVKPVVSRVLVLSEAAKAHELNAQGHTRGKIVLKVV
jgi:NADPH:quinone reductase-like Zn-dependent oxidoreductase